MAEGLRLACHRIGDSASVQAATRVNAEQSSKRTMRKMNLNRDRVRKAMSAAALDVRSPWMVLDVKWMQTREKRRRRGCGSREG